MENFDWKLPIKWNIVMLKIFGLWPSGDESYKCNLYTLYATISIALFVFGNNLTETLGILFIHDDLQAVTSTFFISLTLGIAVLKLYYLIQNMTTLKRLMATVNSDTFQVKNLRQLGLIVPSLNSWKTAYTVYSSMSVVAAFFLSFVPMLDKSVKERRLPLGAWFPYNHTVSPLYELTYIYQATSICFTAGLTVNVDTLIAALNMFVGAQCDILCDDLRHIHEFDDVVAKMKECVNHHRAILRFAEDSNRFFNWIVLVQFFTSAVVLATTMFQLTVVPPFGSEFLTYIMYGTTMLIQIFIYCWFGNEVETKSSNISYAVFESDWTSTSLDFKKRMIFVILRSQKSITVSALNLFYLSLKTFMTILRTSWSYFAVLHRVNGE